MKYRPEIDGLRALAVLAVVGYHAFPSVFPGGFVGVDVFFVISGFLITMILRADTAPAWDMLRGFYARRIVRIFPALILVMVCCLVVGWYVMLGAEYKMLGRHVLGGSTFVSNIFLWLEAGYFDKASETKPLLHLWSLGIEEQFYIVWPLLILALARPPRQGLRLVLALGMASFVAAAWLVLEDRTQAFYSPATRAWELLAGAWLAMREQSALQSLRLRRALAWGGALLMVFAVFFLKPSYPFPGPLALLPVLGAAMVIVARPDAGGGFPWFAARPVVWVGLISYPLYLWHWPLLSFAHLLEAQTPSVGVRAMLVMASVLLAWATYRWVELPVKKLRRSHAVAGLIFLMVLLGLVGNNLERRDGIEPIRLKRVLQLSGDAARDFVDWEKTGLLPPPQCEHPFLFPGSQVCLTQNPAQPATAVLLGDSHAFHAYWGLSEAFAAQGQNLTLRGRGACVPFEDFKRGRDEDKCQPHINQTLKTIQDDRRIESVVLVFRGRYLPNGSDAESKDSMARSMDATLAHLLASGKKVFYVLPVVEPGFDPRLCLGSMPLGRRIPQSCDLSRSRDMAVRSEFTELAKSVLQRHPLVRVIDPGDYLCERDICPVLQNQRSTFKDENHLSYSGSLQLGRLLQAAGALQ